MEEQQILFSEVYYKTYVIKPWSLSNHSRIAPLMLLLIASLGREEHQDLLMHLTRNSLLVLVGRGGSEGLLVRMRVR